MMSSPQEALWRSRRSDIVTHQGQFETKLFGSSNMIWDALAFDRAGVAQTRGNARRQRLAATILDEMEEGRQRILNVAEQLIRRFGHQKTTMANIAWELSISRATLYRYFPTKEALEEQICVRVASRTFRHICDALVEERGASEQLSKTLRELGRQTTARRAMEPHLHHLFAEAFRNRWHVATEYLREISRLIEEIVVKGQANKAFTPGDADKLTKFILGAMLVFVNPALTELLSKDDGELSMDLAMHVQSLVGSITRKNL